MHKERSQKQPNVLLRREREKRGWSQNRLAEMIGADPTMISRWETGGRRPESFYQEKLCTLFGKDAIELGFISDSDQLPSTLPEPATNLSGLQVSLLAPWIPAPPQPFLAHPYPLQKNFTGRLKERTILSSWWKNDNQTLLLLQAIGGMGKSSLVWVWMQQDVSTFPSNLQPDGILWWSFYETDVTFGMFLDQALIYVGNRAINPQSFSSVYEKLQTLVSLLQKHRYLIVLDGFERLLRAYAVSDKDTHEELPGFFRACIDPHTGNFLRWLAASPLKSKILLTTRLAPRELDNLANCSSLELSALSEQDAVSFLQMQGIHGSLREIQTVCALYGNHPLTLRLLAGLIAHDPIRPGNIAVAYDYNPLANLVQRDHHILQISYDALSPVAQQLLSQIAAFRSRVRFEVLKSTAGIVTSKELRTFLVELVERGLLFFDKENGTYDLHPVVRQYAYGRLLQKEVFHTHLAAYFQAQGGLKPLSQDLFPLRKLRALLAYQDNRPDAEILDGLAFAIEFYYHTIQAKNYQSAFTAFYSYLASMLYHRLGAYQLVIELLQGFLIEEDTLVEGLERAQQSWLLDALANAYSASGYPQRAAILLQVSIYRDREGEDKENLAIAYWNLAVQQLVLGDFISAEINLQESISASVLTSDTYNAIKAHQYFALLKAYQGVFDECWIHLEKATVLSQASNQPGVVSPLNAYQALCKLLAGDLEEALKFAQAALQHAQALHYERDIVRAKWLLGSAMTQLAIRQNKLSAEDLFEPEALLTEALKRCRQIDMVDYEADILLACARLYHAKGDDEQAQMACMEALNITDRSDFHVLRADVRNFLARMKLEEGNRQQAIELAQLAKKDAICNGDPYCYRSAFLMADALLEQAEAFS